MTNKPMLSVDMLPCPMCAGKVRSLVARPIGHGDVCFVISCNCGLSFDGGQDIESAVRTWNRRATPAAQHQGEPVAYLDENGKFVFIGYEKLRTACWVDGNDRAIPDTWRPVHAEQSAPVVLVMPDNLISHRNSWLQAMERLVALEAEASPATHDSDDAGYWEHELKAMRAMYADLDRLNGVKP